MSTWGGWLAVALALSSLACGGDETSARADATAGAADEGADGAGGLASWHIVHEDLSGALLSVWGSGPEDVWAVGADPRDGLGPLVLRREGDGWRRLISGVEGHLWWVFGPSADQVMTCGEAGHLLRLDRATGAWQRLETGTDATLYGLWGASADEVWVVGGAVQSDGPGIVLRVRGDDVEAVPLPPEMSPTATLFKVWGAAADQVWFVGEEGTLLHWDGAQLTHQSLPGAPRLVTLHGRGASDLVAVGGLAAGLILEGHDGQWVDATPEATAGLNGVYVAPDGTAAVAGMLASVLQRVDGVWGDLPRPSLPRDWHSVWIDPRGDLYVAGGDLLSAARLDRGTLLRYGPDRAGVAEPATIVTPAPPEPGPEPADAAGGDDRLDAAAAEDTAGGSEVADTAATGEVVTALDGAGDALDDAGPDPADAAAADAPPDDAAGPGDAAADVGVVAGGDFPLTLLHSVLGELAALPAWAEVEIVQGPQGGIHAEVAIEAQPDPADAGGAIVEALLSATTTIDGEVVGSNIIPKLPLYQVDGGATYRSTVFPVYFVQNEAVWYVGQSATIRVELTIGAKTAHAAAPVRLLDTQ